MKEQIIKLREEGLTYDEISRILKCAKSTISYHLNSTTKQQAYKKSRDNIYKKLSTKIDNFKNKSDITQNIRGKVSGFSRDNTRKNKPNPKFGYHDVLDKFGIESNCYLTGRPINLITDNYHFDHIIPTSKGGSNDISNLGISCKEANLAKNNLTVEEFINLCKEVLEYNGYIITRK